MMHPLISIVIPIYCVEKYLERCVRSVITQTYMNLEIILVDDGSPDNCGAICEKLAQEDSRIFVYHKENGGLSDARNFGVKKSHGKFIAFVDSDDYIATDYIEYLYGLLEKYDADISCCHMIIAESDNVNFAINDKVPEEQVMTGKEACKEMSGTLCATLVTAWGNLYKRELVEKYPFPKGRKHEDAATTFKYYYDANKIVIGNACLYAYYKNPNGIMQTLGKDINFDMIWALEHRAMFFASLNEGYLTKLAWNALFCYYISDSLENNGRCDQYLTCFGKGKELFVRVRFELLLYNTFPIVYKLFYKGKQLFRSVREWIKSRIMK